MTFFLLFFLIISLSSADFDHAWSGFLSLQIEIATWWMKEPLKILQAIKMKL